MNARRARRLLLAAFILSALVHAIIALVWQRTSRPLDQPEYVTLRRSVMRVTHVPPRRRITRHAVVKRSAARIMTPHLATATAAHGRAHGAVTPLEPQESQSKAQPTQPPRPPPPTASAVPPGCGKADSAPSVAATVSPPQIAPDVRAQNASGVTSVAVTLDEAGRVTGATVSSSSGNPSLDLVAVSMARTATYTPRYRACKAVAATYTFTVRFVAW